MKKSVFIIGLAIMMVMFSFRSSMQSARMYEPIEFLKVIHYKNKIYVIKPGWCKAFQERYKSASTVQADTIVGAIFEFIPEEIKLRKIADMPDTRMFYGAAIANGNLYIAGGYNAAWKPLSSTYELNLQTKKWNKKASMKKARAHLALEASGSIIFAFYGEGCTGIVERMAIDSNQWRTIKPVATPAANTSISIVGASASTDRKIFIIGNAGKGFLEYNPDENTLRELPPPPFQSEQFSAMVFNKRIYIGAGSLPNALDDKVYMYELTTNSWQTVGKLPAPRCRSAMIPYAGMILFMGGSLSDISQPSKITDEIYMYRPVK